jgi:hypothetical protein
MWAASTSLICPGSLNPLLRAGPWHDGQVPRHAKLEVAPLRPDARQSGMICLPRQTQPSLQPRCLRHHQFPVLAKCHCLHYEATIPTFSREGIWLGNSRPRGGAAPGAGRPSENSEPSKKAKNGSKFYSNYRANFLHELKSVLSAEQVVLRT